MAGQYREADATDLLREATIAVGITVVPVSNASKARRTIVLSNGGTTLITVGTSGQLVAGQGIVLPANTFPVIIDRCDMAPWIVSSLYAIGSAAGGILGVVEIIDQH